MGRGRKSVTPTRPLGASSESASSLYIAFRRSGPSGASVRGTRAKTGNLNQNDARGITRADIEAERESDGRIFTGRVRVLPPSF